MRIAHRRVEVHRHAADRTDEPLEAAEVDLDVVVDLDAEVLANRVDEHLPAASVRRVDAVVLTGVRHRDPEVAREREHLHRAGDGVDADEQDRVGTLARRLARPEERSGVRIVRVDVVATVRTDHEVVAGLLAAGAVEREIGAQELPGDPVEVADARGRGDARDREKHSGRDREALEPGAGGTRRQVSRDGGHGLLTVARGCFGQ